MDAETKDLIDLLELLNRYPSPHNGQPIRLKHLGPDEFEVYFERERGLQATDISFIFSFVSMGVFLEYAETCAKALGHSVKYNLKLPGQNDLRGSGPIVFATLKIHWGNGKLNNELLAALRFRQTSRKKYYEGINDITARKIVEIADKKGMELHELEGDRAAQAIWLNQRAVFDDMFDPAVNRELDHWLRYSKAEKQEKLDGLAYDCMELNGRLMKFTVRHPKVLRLPGIAGEIKSYYLRTMADNSNVFYMLAPFATEQQAFAVGTAITDVWIELSRHGYYIHPFGTIMSNHIAHQDFLELAGVKNESRKKSYLVFIFRAGKSEIPVRSLRLPFDQHLIMR